MYFSGHHGVCHKKETVDLGPVPELVWQLSGQLLHCWWWWIASEV